MAASRWFVRFGVGGVLAVALVAWSVFPALPALPEVSYAPLMVSAGAAHTGMTFAPVALPDGTRLASIGHGAASAPVAVNGAGVPNPYLQPQALLDPPPKSGDNFGSAASFSADGNTLVANATTLTVITPAVAVAATVDIAVTVGMQKTTTHGYTYLGPGGIMPQPQPGAHPAPGSGSLTPMV